MSERAKGLPITNITSSKYYLVWRLSNMEKEGGGSVFATSWRLRCSRQCRPSVSELASSTNEIFESQNCVWSCISLNKERTRNHKFFNCWLQWGDGTYKQAMLIAFNKFSLICITALRYKLTTDLCGVNRYLRWRERRGCKQSPTSTRNKHFCGRNGFQIYKYLIQPIMNLNSKTSICHLAFLQKCLMSIGTRLLSYIYLTHLPPYLRSILSPAFVWLKYCRYGVNINQSINQTEWN